MSERFAALNGRNPTTGPSYGSYNNTAYTAYGAGSTTEGGGGGASSASPSSMSSPYRPYGAARYNAACGGGSAAYTNATSSGGYGHGAAANSSAARLTNSESSWAGGVRETEIVPLLAIGNLMAKDALLTNGAGTLKNGGIGGAAAADVDPLLLQQQLVHVLPLLPWTAPTTAVALGAAERAIAAAATNASVRPSIGSPSNPADGLTQAPFALSIRAKECVSLLLAEAVKEEETRITVCAAARKKAAATVAAVSKDATTTALTDDLTAWEALYAATLKEYNSSSTHIATNNHSSVALADAATSVRAMLRAGGARGGISPAVVEPSMCRLPPPLPTVTTGHIVGGDVTTTTPNAAPLPTNAIYTPATTQLFPGEMRYLAAPNASQLPFMIVGAADGGGSGSGRRAGSSLSVTTSAMTPESSHLTTSMTAAERNPFTSLLAVASRKRLLSKDVARVLKLLLPPPRVLLSGGSEGGRSSGGESPLDGVVGSEEKERAAVHHGQQTVPLPRYHLAPTVIRCMFSSAGDPAKDSTASLSSSASAEGLIAEVFRNVSQSPMVSALIPAAAAALKSPSTVVNSCGSLGSVWCRNNWLSLCEMLLIGDEEGHDVDGEGRGEDVDNFINNGIDGSTTPIMSPSAAAAPLPFLSSLVEFNKDLVADVLLLLHDVTWHYRKWCCGGVNSGGVGGGGGPGGVTDMLLLRPPSPAPATDSQQQFPHRGFNTPTPPPPKALLPTSHTPTSGAGSSSPSPNDDDNKAKSRLGGTHGNITDDHLTHEEEDLLVSSPSAQAFYSRLAYTLQRCLYAVAAIYPTTEPQCHVLKKVADYDFGLLQQQSAAAVAGGAASSSAGNTPISGGVFGRRSAPTSPPSKHLNTAATTVHHQQLGASVNNAAVPPALDQSLNNGPSSARSTPAAAAGSGVGATENAFFGGSISGPNPNTAVGNNATIGSFASSIGVNGSDHDDDDGAPTATEFPQPLLSPSVYCVLIATATDGLLRAQQQVSEMQQNGGSSSALPSPARGLRSPLGSPRNETGDAATNRLASATTRSAQLFCLLLNNILLKNGTVAVVGGGGGGHSASHFNSVSNSPHVASASAVSPSSTLPRRSANSQHATASYIRATSTSAASHHQQHYDPQTTDVDGPAASGGAVAAGVGGGNTVVPPLPSIVGIGANSESGVATPQYPSSATATPVKARVVVSSSRDLIAPTAATTSSNVLSSPLGSAAGGVASGTRLRSRSEARSSHTTSPAPQQQQHGDTTATSLSRLLAPESVVEVSNMALAFREVAEARQLFQTIRRLEGGAGVVGLH